VIPEALSVVNEAEARLALPTVNAIPMASAVTERPTTFILLDCIVFPSLGSFKMISNNQKPGAPIVNAV